MSQTSDQPKPGKPKSAKPTSAADAAREREALFSTIAGVAALAHRRGERRTAVMLSAVVAAYG